MNISFQLDDSNLQNYAQDYMSSATPPVVF